MGHYVEVTVAADLHRENKGYFLLSYESKFLILPRGENPSELTTQGAYLRLLVFQLLQPTI